MSSGWQRRIRTCTSGLAAVRAVLPAPTCVLGKRGAGRLLLGAYWDWNAGAALYFPGYMGAQLDFSWGRPPACGGLAGRPAQENPRLEGRGRRSRSFNWRSARPPQAGGLPHTGVLECDVHGA